MMAPILALGIVAACIAIIRQIVAARVERRDGFCPRDDDGVRLGAEGFTLARPGAPAALLLHGAGDTPQTLRELGEYLHACGFAVTAPLLPGHGRSARAFRKVSSQMWQAAAMAAYDDLRAQHSWAGVVGLSMGGALAAITVADRRDTPALVLLAPYLGLPRGLRFAAAVSRIANLFSPYFASGDPRSVHDPIAAARGLAYGVFTPAAMRALRDTTNAGLAALPHVRTPTLIVQSRDDNRIAPEVAERALRLLASPDKRLEWTFEGGHVITVDYGKDRVFSLTADWLLAHGAGSLLEQ